MRIPNIKFPEIKLHSDTFLILKMFAMICGAMVLIFAAAAIVILMLILTKGLIVVLTIPIIATVCWYLNVRSARADDERYKRALEKSAESIAYWDALKASMKSK